jgi:hypothetical protein
MTHSYIGIRRDKNRILTKRYNARINEKSLAGDFFAAQRGKGES